MRGGHLALFGWSPAEIEPRLVCAAAMGGRREWHGGLRSVSRRYAPRDFALRPIVMLLARRCYADAARIRKSNSGQRSCAGQFDEKCSHTRRAVSVTRTPSFSRWRCNVQT